MAKFSKKKGGELPPISTASLPDIVFMLLFFFMVATTMRETNVMVKQDLPKADQVEKLENKNLVMYIYAGPPSPNYQQQFGTSGRIQLNDKFARVEDIQSFILAERESKNPGIRSKLITGLKIDEETNMSLVSDITDELRKVEAYRINYTTRQGDPTAESGL
ncbi:MAG TPA: biopolymer transporter ExbD [Flavobacteriaceae bacterium]|nr:biopolymer transporter ExbD [Flavobacteriaceae bacterium]